MIEKFEGFFICLLFSMGLWVLIFGFNALIH
jgi:hypothetical protein